MLAQSRQQLGARDFHHGKQQVLHSTVFHSFFPKRTCFDFLRTERSSLRAKNRFSRYIMIWVWIWLAKLGTFCLSSNFSFWLSNNFWTLIFHPIMFQGNLWRKPKWRIFLLVYNFSSFHPNNFRDTISWECFVKNDSVRSCLIELQSVLQSKVDVDPIYRVLMFLPCFVHVLCKTRCFPKSIVSGSLCSLSIGSTGSKNTVSRLLKFFLPVSILNWWWNVNSLHIRRD